MTTMLLEQNARFAEAFAGVTLKAEIEQCSPSIIVVRLRGEAVSDLTDDLARQLYLPAVQTALFAILDMSELTSISPEAPQTLVEFRCALCCRGGEMWLAGLQPAVWLALRAANQDQRFAIRDSVAQVFAP
jgi:anti-anti-sigma regulatory factor